MVFLQTILYVLQIFLFHNDNVIDLNTKKVNQNYYDMRQNVQTFKDQYTKMANDPNDKYDFKASSFNKAPTQLDGLINDNREIIMQQNSMYILSTITVATLVLALILVYK
jgi:hypothetical protein